MRALSSLRASRIAVRFVGYLLLVALLPLCIVGFVALRHAEQTLQEQALQRLTTVADSRARRMANYFFERKGDAMTLSRVRLLERGVRDLEAALTAEDGFDSEAYRQADGKLRPFLNQYRDAYGYADILLISVAGDVLFSINRGPERGVNFRSDPHRETPLGRVFDQAQMLLEPQVSDYRPHDADGEPAFFVSAPILDSKGQVEAVLALRLPNRDVRELAQDYMGLGETGETLLATAIDKDAVVITPTRGDPQAAFSRKVEIGSPEGAPIQHAVRGRRGHGQFIDYRGERVLAVWRYLPSARWGLVVKMDAREVFTEVQAIKRLGFIAVSGTFLFVLLSAALLLGIISRKVSEPLRELARTARLIAGGDLSHKIPVTSQDELGELAGAFNSMMDDVNEARARAEASYQELKEENRVKTTVAELNEVMSGEKEPEHLGRALLEFFVPHFGAQVGAFFVRVEKGHLQRVSTYAFEPEDVNPDTFEIGEGLVGEVAAQKRILHVDQVPEHYMAVRSSLGAAPPTELVVVPVVHEERVEGVFELGTLQSFSPQKQLLLEALLPHVGIALHSAIVRRQRRELLEKTQMQAEELQQQQEELQVTNEELEEQTKALQQSQEELQQQQEELQVTNEELEEQKEALEEQKAQLESVNREVEGARRQLQEKALALELASRYKSEFLANMSHELRTPLNSLLILSKMLMDNPDQNLSTKQVDYATTIYQSGSDLLDVIDDVLDLSKVEAGKLAIHWEPTPLRSLLDHVERTFRPVAEGKRLDLRVEQVGPLPREIQTDSKRVQQILKNLLSNAFKFCKEGEVAVRIQRPGPDVELSHPWLIPESTIGIAVSDTGIGIPKDRQEEIFSAFQQADGTISRHYGGTGLGLSISRELSWLLEGEIRLESEEGVGSTFTLYLPEKPPDRHKKQGEQEAANPPAKTGLTPDRGEPSEESTPPPAQEPEPGTAPVASSEKTMLIIENDQELAELIGKVAKQKGYANLVAREGHEGLKLAVTHMPTAIILDLNLPGLDALTVMHRLVDNPDTRHIPIHTIGAPETGHDARRMGAVGCLKRPVAMDDLQVAFKRIEEVVSTSVKRLLIVEEDTAERQGMVQLVQSQDTEIIGVNSAEEAYELLKGASFDCMILDLSLPGRITPMELLNRMNSEDNVSHPPVIVYTDKDLTADEEEELRKFAESIVIKGPKSPERLVDEVALFLHRVEADLPKAQREMMESLHTREAVFEGKTVLLVDDDMRNLFALTHVLEDKGMHVLVAKNGREALERLRDNPAMDLVLMDIMMPEMDGYEAMRSIREERLAADVSIIALTAKAMKGDREKCIEAGANDYLAKPVDVDRLLSLMRVWLQ